ncbi:nuclear receptor-interacting protein 3-like [Xiphias gladius]|uniref:nuclear receptor-interacting protein 3-like n=1 Tax=Xiphias gladius TaxID=8245 RepID=UPI001A990CC1|nr:nuclear receptor-interacting protein 3-like [Xiphias gladius]
MFAGIRTEDREDPGVLDAAAVRHQRRLKQAVRFLHQESADLLPLGGLKKLGTCKQGQPQRILQMRLPEDQLSRGRTGMRGVTPTSGGVLGSNFNAHEDGEEEGEEEEEEEEVHLRALQVAGVTSLRALMWDGCVSLVPATLFLPISASSYDRRVRELQIPTSAPAPYCSWLCARSSSCTPRLFCTDCSASASCQL